MDKKISNRHLFKIVAVPLVVIIGVFMLVQTLSQYRKYEIKRNEFNQYAKTIIEGQTSYFIDEIFLDKVNGIEKRIGIIEREFNSYAKDAKICIRVEWDTSSSGRKFSEKGCDQTLAKKAEWINIPLKLSSLEPGIVSFYLVDTGMWNSILPRNLIFPLFISIILGLWVALFLVRRLQKTVVSPLLDRIESNAKTSALKSFVQELAHDLANPISAQSSLIVSMKDSINETDWVKLYKNNERIRKIAKDLKDPFIKDSNSSVTFLDTLIQDIVPDIQGQCVNQNIRISYNCEYGIFVKLNQGELERIISNIAKNSIEAIVSGGNIEISSKKEGQFANICIKDDGMGIGPENLNKVFENKFSTKSGKTGNMGIGLTVAKNKVESIGGAISLNSNEGSGTSVSLSLPMAAIPEWFVDKISLQRYKQIVVLDDQKYIFEDWQKRLNSYCGRIIFLDSVNAFEKFMENADKARTLFLIDFDLKEEVINGFDLIKSHRLSSNAILVTNSSDNVQVRDLCCNIGLKLLPKSLVPLVPIVIDGLDSKIYYLDDDSVSTETIRYVLNKRNIKNIFVENDPIIFKERLTSASKQKDKIVLDSNLGDNSPKGEEIASDLIKEGFQNVYLATGYDELSIPGLKVKGIISKSDPKFVDRIAEL